jgi:hypothetical protein
VRTWDCDLGAYVDEHGQPYHEDYDEDEYDDEWDDDDHLWEHYDFEDEDEAALWNWQLDGDLDGTLNVIPF